MRNYTHERGWEIGIDLTEIGFAAQSKRKRDDQARSHQVGVIIDCKFLQNKKGMIICSEISDLHGFILVKMFFMV